MIANRIDAAPEWSTPPSSRLYICDLIVSMVFDVVEGRDEVEYYTEHNGPEHRLEPQALIRCGETNMHYLN